MKYLDAIDFLYSTAPMFQNVGSKGYKSGLENTLLLDKYFGFPHKDYRTIHVGGTNGKGSTSHLIAAVLQSAGYKVGLYTSPHLKDFCERIKIDGKMISKQKVASFISKNQELIKKINPSFFEITTMLAFSYFSEQNIDIAVVEVGLGGRLDCTNIISPMISVITNISLDHTDLLGSSTQQIATEKAGIIKPNTTVVIGETQKDVKNIFVEKAKENSSKIVFADKKQNNKTLPKCQLKGIYQKHNIQTALSAIDQLKELGLKIRQNDITRGFGKVSEMTGLIGRWHVISHNPTIVCDTGHNRAGIASVVEQLKQDSYNRLHIVFGMVSDKQRNEIYALLPKDAIYYFTKASIPRALDQTILMKEASAYGLNGESYKTVRKAMEAATKAATKKDLIYVGGSTFVVADAI